jgi:predicted secreted hydrolase
MRSSLVPKLAALRRSLGTHLLRQFYCRSRRKQVWITLAVVFLFRSSIEADSPPSPDPWQRAIGPWSWVFPRDHGAHPNFRTEWWYFTGNLEDEAHRKFGYQLTIFRQGVQYTPAQTHSHWAARDFYFGHFTISDLEADQFHVAERVSRGALGEAKAAPDRMDVALGPWTIQQEGAGEQYHLVAHEPGMAIDFEEHPLKPLVREGVGGLSQKAQGMGEASYYYSDTRLETSGRLRIGEKNYAVSGLSWFDHEFSTSSLGKDEVGWDWFCIQLENHEEIMLYALRDKSGAIDPASEGTWVKADGTSERLAPGSFSIEKKAEWKSPHSGAVYPAGWHIVVPGHRADLTVSPAMADQELCLTKMGALDYWEGACSIEGRVADAPVKGVGYTELTGYAGALQMGTKP